VLIVLARRGRNAAKAAAAALRNDAKREKENSWLQWAHEYIRWNN
jgi:hypothetical protein